MELPNEIVLRPRFQDVFPECAGNILERLEKAGREPFVIKRLDDHLFIKFNDREQHFWSPQLQLEILDEEQGACRVYGLYGPNPTLWSFFMFLHFGVATLFIILGIWAYSSASLDRPYGVQAGGMVFMVVVWFALYAFGRAGRAKGKPQMHELYNFYREGLRA
ncbi:MAG: GTP-binding protein [Robiginitalea sp.]